jgi:hypothetical protein
MIRLFLPLIIPCLLILQVSAFNKELKVAIVHYNAEELILPGSSFPIGIQLVSLVNGEEKIEFTKGLLHGNVSWRKLSVEVQGGNFQFGKVFVSDDLSVAPGQFIEVRVRMKKTGQVIAVEKIPLNYVAGIFIFSNDKIIRAPGNSFSVALTTIYDNGIQKQYLKNRLVRKELNNYDVYTTGGWIGEGSFYISPDPDLIESHTCGVVLQHKNNAMAADTFEIQLDYIDQVHFQFSGTSGWWGTSGSSGFSGFSCGNGQPGNNGQPGTDGRDGPDLEIYAYEYYDTLLKINLLRVESVNLFSGQKKVALLNHLNGATFSATTIGGSGGNGGCGGNGGDGGNGKDGERKTITQTEEKIEKDKDGKDVKKTIQTTHIQVGPGQNGGDGGCGGNGGPGGWGGNGGNIYLCMDDSTRHYYGTVLNVSTIGGWGGNGGSGGRGGNGGSGGNGSPNGRRGCDGHHGLNGFNGDRGYPGEVIMIDMQYRQTP